MIYEHPLAYLLGLEGVALMRAFTGDGDYDREFVEARLAEVRALLADQTLADAAVEVDRVDTVAGYRVWSATYDEPGNTAIEIEEPVVRAIVDSLPVGAALDAACGTGRHAEYLAGRGHRVVGVDGSPDMLARARTRVPEAEFHLGDLRRLPIPDADVDLVVCALALTHVPDLAPVLAEFARVLRPGGQVVISDLHPERVVRGSIPHARDQNGRPGQMPGYHHRVGDYLRAALAAGLRVRQCAEPPLPDAEPKVATTTTGPWEIWPWSLADMVPAATQAANAGVPAMIIWQFELVS